MSERWRAELDTDRSELSAAGGGTTRGRRPMSRAPGQVAVSVLTALYGVFVIVVMAVVLSG